MAALHSIAFAGIIRTCRLFFPADMLSTAKRTISYAEAATVSFKNHTIFLSFHKKLEKYWMSQKARLNNNYPIRKSKLAVQFNDTSGIQ